jgi:hypothetical protein
VGHSRNRTLYYYTDKANLIVHGRCCLGLPPNFTKVSTGKESRHFVNNTLETTQRNVLDFQLNSYIMREENAPSQQCLILAHAVK